MMIIIYNVYLISGISYQYVVQIAWGKMRERERNKKKVNFKQVNKILEPHEKKR